MPPKNPKKGRGKTKKTQPEQEDPPVLVPEDTATTAAHEDEMPPKSLNKGKGNKKTQPEEEEPAVLLTAATADDGNEAAAEAPVEEEEVHEGDGQLLQAQAVSSDDDCDEEGPVLCGIPKELEQELAEFFAANELFYNKQLSDFKNTQKKERKLKTLGEQLGVPGEYYD